MYNSGESKIMTFVRTAHRLNTNQVHWVIHVSYRFNYKINKKYSIPITKKQRTNKWKEIQMKISDSLEKNIPQYKWKNDIWIKSLLWFRNVGRYRIKKSYKDW